ncbi:MAG: SDR family NAD(P)-dependent oxidoreductase [Propionibacteriales bacterium]|nr:SDR family NAD(P)-dependent oxidoreductase [Propionibacteriales bacterium]
MTEDARVILVTGASSGIGRATAHALARRGDHLVLLARAEQPLRDTAGECERAGAAGVRVMTADVADQAQLDAVVRDVEEGLGAIDAVVNCAGVVAYGDFVDIPSEVFDGVLKTNVIGSANVARSVLPGMRERGRGSLVLVGSVIGHIAVPRMSPYVLSKWAIRSLARELQLEHRSYPEINVSYVAPGSVDTPIYLLGANYSGYVGRPPPPVISPERVAQAIVTVLERPRQRVDVGAANALMRLGFSLTPKLFDILVGPLSAVAALDQEELGPGPGNVLTPRPELNRLLGQQGSSVLATAKAVWRQGSRLIRRP